MATVTGQGTQPNLKTMTSRMAPPIPGPPSGVAVQPTWSNTQRTSTRGTGAGRSPKRGRRSRCCRVS
eukprot:51393-Rhodomonas_salina.1